MVPKKLTDFEEKVYIFIKKHGELLTTKIPVRMMGAIPSLKNKGFVKIFKRRTSLWGQKKRKFVKIKEQRVIIEHNAI